jgi:curved DNA-binding protein CbpA
MYEKKRAKRRTKSAPRAIPQETPYGILEIPETATFDEIRKAYLAKVRLSPPEKDAAGFKRVQKAYSVLKDAISRKTLDLSMFRRELEPGAAVDAVTLDVEEPFKDRVFRLLLASSDLYMKDFSRYFTRIDGDIGDLS